MGRYTYTTPLSEVRVGSEGWYKIPGFEYEISKLPLQRKSTNDGGPFFARITYQQAENFFAEPQNQKDGWRLPKPEELDALINDANSTFVERVSRTRRRRRSGSAPTRPARSSTTSASWSAWPQRATRGRARPSTWASTG
jgi:hypothetical protein